MKYGVVAYPNSLNIGDDIQCLAAMGLLDQVDYYIDRDQIDKPLYDEKIKLICNGWFTETPDNWPPAPNYHPLFISFHVTDVHNSTKKLVNSKFYDYYKQFEPIGCRDYDTVALFEKIGIKAYFSGCMTLTLENKYDYRTDDIYLVDPFYKYDRTRQYLRKSLDALVPEKFKKDVHLITHDDWLSMHTVEDRLERARGLLKKYATAKMVITSRIHCALPCLALGTPVYFVDVGYKQRNRFKGILDLMHCITDEHFPVSTMNISDSAARYAKLYKNMEFTTPEINWENPPANPDGYKKVRANIISKVKDFMAD